MLTLLAGIFGLLTGASLATGRKGLSMLRPSPVKGIVLVSWTRFTTCMARHPRDYKSSRGRMGAFGLDGRRLADVGFMTLPRKVTIGTETGVWTGDWKAPLDEKKYLTSLPLQYEAFKRSMTKMAPTVAGFVGADVDGKKCTLSGLLGVGHLAGEGGVASWVKSDEIRKKFPNTTATFNRTNGIF